MAQNSDSQRKNSQRRRGPGRPFQPGESGNPGGRPRGFAALVREMTLEGVPLVEFALRVQRGEEVDGASGTLKEQIAAVQLRLDATKWLAERGWGAPQQHIEHSGPDGGALSISIDLGAGK